MLFNDFALVAEQLAATTKKLEKAALLKEYLAGLTDADLMLSTRFLAGRPFALSDERVLNVGWAVVRDAICALSGMAPEEFGALATRMGEAGAAAEIALDGHAAAAATLTLADVDAFYTALALARGPTQKRPLLIDMLRQATALEAKYLIKIMGGDLRIGLQEGQLEDALARAAGVTVHAVQWANMLIGDIGEAAVLARHGRLGEARMRLFHPLKFMLASPIQSPEEIRRSIAGAFFIEDKYDGIRGQVHKSGDRLAIYSRTLDEITHRFPELHAPLLALPGELILDGEILAARDGRILPFKELQPRLGRKTVDDQLLAQTPVIFVAYDLLYHDGAVLLETALAERRARLEELLRGDRETRRQGEGDPESMPICLFPLPPVSSSWLKSCDDLADIDPLFEAARARGNEGLMVKDPASAYKPGRRGREWLKVKRALATLDVVVTAVEVGYGKRRHVLSDYTFAVRASEDDPTLLNIGKAYSGLTDAEIAELTEWFKAHTIKDFGRVRLVEPKIVLEVAFDIVQPSARHKSGYALRFPRIMRIRDDKPVAEIDTLEAVRRLAGASDIVDE
ncbi:MAG TPA: ATP-dependent DNA ligase [Roseiflexaceae bacterium]|nr:ATP-dependent DNA ligase [Roseiflexaceae bacterium]